MADESPRQDDRLPADARLDRLEERLVEAQRKEAIPCSLSSVYTVVTDAGAAQKCCKSATGERWKRWDKMMPVTPKWQKKTSVSRLAAAAS